jgi:hypothetical protein
MPTFYNKSIKDYKIKMITKKCSATSWYNYNRNMAQIIKAISYLWYLHIICEFMICYIYFNKRGGQVFKSSTLNIHKNFPCKIWIRDLPENII